jgi:hypothetical protein
MRKQRDLFLFFSFSPKFVIEREGERVIAFHHPLFFPLYAIKSAKGIGGLCADKKVIHN